VSRGPIIARASTPLRALERAIVEAGTAQAFAVQHGLSPQYVGDVRYGRRAPGPAILAALGLERRVSYVRTGAPQ